MQQENICKVKEYKKYYCWQIFAIQTLQIINYFLNFATILGA